MTATKMLDVPRIHFKVGESAFSPIVSLVTALRAMGEKITYRYVMGVSGAAFRLYWMPGFDPSSASVTSEPVALLGVAAGQIGAIKGLEHLRSVCSHVGAIVLPGPVSVARVQDLFDERGRCGDEVTERRIRGVATTLLDYIRKNICPGVALEEMARRGSLSWARVAGA